MKKQIAIFTLLLIFGCKKNEPLETETTLDQQQKTEIQSVPGAMCELLDCLGFDTTGANQAGDFMLVENDIVIEKEALDNIQLPFAEIFDAPKALERQHSFSTGALVGLTPVADVKVFIDPTIMNNATSNIHYKWAVPVVQALVDWENVLNCRVNFSITTNLATANLGIVLDDYPLLPLNMKNLPYGSGPNGPTGDGGRGCFPSGGNVGKWISLNRNLSNVLSAAQKKHTVRHELGHTLGLRHNNNQNSMGGQDPLNITTCGAGTPTISGINLIAGTPPNDPVSVMNSGFLTLALSADDREAMQYMYPENYVPATITNVKHLVANVVRVTTATVPAPQKPYVIVVARYAPGATNNSQISSFYYPTNNKRILDVACPSGTWVYKVWYVNYGTYAVVSNSATVTVP